MKRKITIPIDELEKESEFALHFANKRWSDESKYPVLIRIEAHHDTCYCIAKSYDDFLNKSLKLLDAFFDECFCLPDKDYKKPEFTEESIESLPTSLQEEARDQWKHYKANLKDCNNDEWQYNCAAFALKHKLKHLALRCVLSQYHLFEFRNLMFEDKK